MRVIAWGGVGCRIPMPLHDITWIQTDTGCACVLCQAWYTPVVVQTRVRDQKLFIMHSECVEH